MKFIIANEDKEQKREVFLKYSYNKEYIWICVGIPGSFDVVFSIPTSTKWEQLPVVMRGSLDKIGFPNYLSHPDRYCDLTRG